MIVGFQGEPGAFSEAAARELFGPDITTVGYRTFDDLVDAVDDGDVDFGLLPVENSIHGSIARAYDLLADHPGVRVVDETTHRIVQALLGTAGATVDGLRTIESHPVAIEQCRAFLRAHPNVGVRVVDDTAGAVRAIVERGDPSAGAIGPAHAADVYGAKVLVGNVQDDLENVTRFFAIARTHAPRRQLGRACLALDLPHEPGSLHAALGVFAQSSLNLRSLVARPARTRPFHYRFYVEIDCPDEALMGVLRTEFQERMTVLGRY